MIPLTSSYHYVRFSISPPTNDALTVRKTLQDALMQSFGLVSANTYMDVLWLAEDGSEVVIRVGERYVMTLKRNEPILTYSHCTIAKYQRS